MQSRLDIQRTAPQAYRSMAGIESYVRNSGLEPELLELVKVRASQINGCAFCIDMHTKDARANGESEQRLYALTAWRETPFFTDRERAALAWTEAVTLISETHAPDDVYEEVRQRFTEKVGRPDHGDCCHKQLESPHDWIQTVPGTYQPLAKEMKSCQIQEMTPMSS